MLKTRPKRNLTCISTLFFSWIPTKFIGVSNKYTTTMESNMCPIFRIIDLSVQEALNIATLLSRTSFNQNNDTFPLYWTLCYSMNYDWRILKSEVMHLPWIDLACLKKIWNQILPIEFQ